MSRSLNSLTLLLTGMVAFSTTSAQAQSSSAATIAAAPTTARPAQALIDDAVKAAKEGHKAVLVDFSTTGCGWCVRFEKFVHSPEVGPLMAAHFVPVTIRVEDEGNPLNNAGSADLMKAFGGATAGYPFLAFLDENGKLIANSAVMPPNNGNFGHPAKPEEIQAFDALLQKTAPRMTADDRAKIAAYLTNMQHPATAAVPAS